MAVIAALIMHVLILGAVEWFGLFDPPQRRTTPEPINIVFSSPQPAAASEQESNDPTQFSELPEDRSDLAPDDPDFLSNVDSRARDRAVDDSETEMPRMEGQSESPHVALREQPAGETEAGASGEQGQREQASNTPAGGDEALAEQQEQSSTARSREGVSMAELLRNRDAGRSGDSGEESGLSGRPGSGDDDRIQESRLGDARYSLRANGAAFFQEEMENFSGNVSLFGDISLNTLQWEFAPWIQRFIRDYHRNWVPPYAYWALGLTSGYQLVDVEVAPNGRLLHLEVIEEEGHEALRESTMTTFRAFAPYHRLPAEFPEPTLKMRIKVIYAPRR
ncbi:hypothetical protein DRQ53_05525 [bacterium]|nr:MAG: hypothetical protein DRQ53_05525 [bacterium]